MALARWAGATGSSAALADAQGIVAARPERFLPELKPFPLPASAGDSSLGVNAQFLFPLFSPSQWALHARLMEHSGIQIVRVDALWASAEPSPPTNGRARYDWRYFDGIVSTLAAAGLRWLPIVDFSTPWDASYAAPNVDSRLSPPRDPRLFADYATALVARYGPRGSFWREHPGLPSLPVQAVEVWNEENSATFWHPSPNAARYLRLYEAVRAAVHAVSRHFEVIVGGLTVPDQPFLNQLYTAAKAIRRPFDAVAVHPYGATPSQVLAGVEATRAVLDAHHDVDVPIDVTEFGWPTRGLSDSAGAPPVTDAERATYLTQVTRSLAESDCGVERILPNTWVTQQQSLLDPAQWFGIVNPNGTMTKTGTAYGMLLANLEAAPADHAAEQLCRTAPKVAVTRLSKPVRDRRTSRRRVGRKACEKVTVAYADTALDDATVRISFTPAPSQNAARIVDPVTHTDSHGRALVCLRAPRVTRGTLTLLVSRGDFASSTSLNLPFTVR